MKRAHRTITACGLLAALGAAVWVWRDRLPVVGRGPEPKATFSRDVAPILYARCAACHRPEGAAPFPLLTYADARKHARQIADVTANRTMPPWQPEPGYGHFAGERRLNDQEIAALGRWVRQGAPEGSPSDLPPPPHFEGGWQLGKPDLVVTLPEPYALPPEGDAGKDVYRNFVVPIPLDRAGPAGSSPGPRYVRSVEIDPGNPRCVHHAFALFDRTRESRRLDERDPGPGFGGMDTGGGAQSPGGQFLSWQPGKVAVAGDADAAWRLDAGTDLVLQLHMRPTGKAESVRPSVAFYFSPGPAAAPTRQALKIRLSSLTIDIPPNSTDTAVEDSYRLPADVELRAVLPHAHYLAKDIRGWATLPDGSRRELLWIKDWDFNWQGEYVYAEPVRLPRGTVLSMRTTFDNSAANPRNPHRPPVRVTYGPQASDEMAELWFQVCPVRNEDLTLLARDFDRKRTAMVVDKLRRLTGEDPNDPDKRLRLAKALLADGRNADAERELRTVLLVRPGSAEARDLVGRVLLEAGDLAGARAEFEQAVSLDPASYESRNDLGLAHLRARDWSGAAEWFRQALRLNGDDPIAHVNLGIALLNAGDSAAAEAEFLAALRLNPDLPLAKAGLDRTRSKPSTLPNLPSPGE